MSKIYVIADTHFNHQNIIKYCHRPFKDVTEMNKTIIDNWNQVVTNDDIVYHLGDFGFGTKEELQQIFEKLNGKKYLIMGNHDVRVGAKYYEESGFIKVYRKEYTINNYVLTHKPKEVSTGFINIYGHIHNKPVEPIWDDNQHLCVSLEKTNYKPVELTKLK